MGLNLDRVGAARYLISVRRDEDIVNFVKSNRFDGYAPAQDPAIRDKIAELWIEAQVCRLMTMRSMSIVKHGGNFTYEGSAEKVWAPEHGVRTTEAISQMLGPYGQLLNGSPHAVEQRRVRAQPDGRVPVRHQPRQHAGDARPGRPPRPRHAHGSDAGTPRIEPDGRCCSAANGEPPDRRHRGG